SKIFNDYNKNYIFIILSYGFFVGWMLSFPYNGPIYEYLAQWYNFSGEYYPLAYIGVPIVFLVFFGYVNSKERFPKRLVIYSAVVSLGGNLLLFFGVTYWYLIFTFMGIASVMFVVGWSYFYTISVSYKDKIKVMGLTIILGNIVQYVINLLVEVGLEVYALNTLIAVLVISLISSSFLGFQKSYDYAYDTGKDIKKLMILVCGILFLININDGLSQKLIEPFFRNIDFNLLFYKKIPYIMGILVMVVFSDKISHIYSFYIALFLIGMANVVFMVLGVNEVGFYVNETILQSGLGIGDLFAWTIVGHVGHLYGRPYKITSYGLIALLTSVFIGRVLGIVFSNYAEGGIYTIAVSYTTVFLTMLVIPKLIQTIDRDVVKIKEKNKLESRINSLTDRELQIYKLLIKGKKNQEIAEELFISDNTLKTHLRNIYKKLNVAGKKELL
ncbi:MAG: LuxR family transcriptional regulator, partial [Eubacteriales bacterium]